MPTPAMNRDRIADLVCDRVVPCRNDDGTASAALADFGKSLGDCGCSDGQFDGAELTVATRG